MRRIALAQLGEIADLQAGVGFPVNLQGRSSGDYPVAKVGDISRVGRSSESVINASENYIDEGDLAHLKARPIPPGSVLFAKIGEAIRHNHRVIAGCELLVDNNAMAAIPNKKVESRYLYHFLRTVDFYGLSSATTVPALRKSKLERLPVPLPPLPEQQRITEILNKADVMRAKRQATIAQLDTLTQSIFLDMFGDPATNPKEWPRPSLLTFLETAEVFVDGDWVESKDQDSDGDVRLIQLADIGDGIYLDKSSRFLTSDTARRLRCTPLRIGDILIARMPDPLGRACQFPGDARDAVTVVDVCIIRPGPKGPHPTWLMCCINTPGFRSLIAREATGTTRSRISRGNLSRLPVIAPPIALQQEFAHRLEAVTELREKSVIAATQCDTIFASLQHRAFRGDL